MRSLALAAIGWLAAATVHAQITYLSDARSASGHGALDLSDFAGAVSISYSGDDSQSATPSAPFADFNTSLHGGAQADVMWAYGGQRRYGAAFSAAQTSALSPLQLSYSGSASAAQNDPFSLVGVASSASQFLVSFSVSNSIPYALRCTPSGGSLGWTLSSSSLGVIISENYPPSQDYSEHIYTGTFLPDQTYTLQANILEVSGFPGANPIGSLMAVCIGNPSFSVPGVWTSWATAVTPTNATLNGTVNPNSWPTTGWFQWGTTTSYGNLISVNNLGSGTNALALSAPVAGLTLGTTYHFRAAATNIAGVVYGSDQSFTTPRAPAYTVLKNFTGSDGMAPVAGLVLQGSTLYGTTTAGGSSINPTNATDPGNGVVFKMNVDGSGYTVLKNFTGSDGGGPVGRLLLAGSTFYGTAEFGGSSYDSTQHGSGYGVVFKMNTDGSGYAVLKNFTGSDGRSPQGALVLVGSTLYGVTYYGGHGIGGMSNGYGVVFKVNTDGSGYTVLKYFEGLDGAMPAGGLVLGGSTLFGCTVAGGAAFRPPTDYGYGVVFKLNTDGSSYAVLTDLYYDCWYGYGDLVLAGGSTLYGTAESTSRLLKSSHLL